MGMEHGAEALLSSVRQTLELKTQSWVQADKDGEGSPTESGMSMDSIPMRRRSRKPKHVYNAADVAPLQAPWKASTFKPKKVYHLPLEQLNLHLFLQLPDLSPSTVVHTCQQSCCGVSTTSLSWSSVPCAASGKLLSQVRMKASLVLHTVLESCRPHSKSVLGAGCSGGCQGCSRPGPAHGAAQQGRWPCQAHAPGVLPGAPPRHQLRHRSGAADLYILALQKPSTRRSSALGTNCLSRVSSSVRCSGWCLDCCDWASRAVLKRGLTLQRRTGASRARCTRA